jgi:hypothetical protein
MSQALLRRLVLLLGLWAGLGLLTPAEAAACGAANQRPCKLWERIPSCDKGLAEDFIKGRCLRPAVPGRDCGRAGQRPCKLWERVPSCNVNLKEDFAQNRCVAVACGKKLGTPCKVWERIPSCDSGLVENFIKGRCVPSADAERHRIAGAKLKQLGPFIAAKVGFATQVANDPQVQSRLSGANKAAVAGAVNTSAVGPTQMPDGYLLRTLTVGATGGGKFLFVGTSGGAGAAIDLKGQRPAYAYATGDYSFGLGLAASGGVDVGFWVCQNNKIGGDSWGVEFGVDDLAAAYVGAASLKKGPSLGIGLWFDYRNVFQGFTITPGFGVGADFGGVVKAATAVEGDDSVDCDGRPLRTAAAAPGAARIFVQDIRFPGGVVRHYKRAGNGRGTQVARVCLTNRTATPKQITHRVPAINPLSTPTSGSSSCANFPSNMRLNFAFADRGAAKKTDVMTLSAYAGQTVEFEWISDR